MNNDTHDTLERVKENISSNKITFQLGIEPSAIETALYILNEIQKCGSCRDEEIKLMAKRIYLVTCHFYKRDDSFVNKNDILDEVYEFQKNIRGPINLFFYKSNGSNLKSTICNIYDKLKPMNTEELTRFLDNERELPLSKNKSARK